MDGQLRVPHLETDPLVLEQSAIIRYIEHLSRPVSLPAGELEYDFVRHVIRYSIRLGIGVEAWREIGVPEEVLNTAGFQ